MQGKNLCVQGLWSVCAVSVSAADVVAVFAAATFEIIRSQLEKILQEELIHEQFREISNRFACPSQVTGRDATLTWHAETLDVDLPLHNTAAIHTQSFIAFIYIYHKRMHR